MNNTSSKMPLEKEAQAAKLYDDMLENYRNITGDYTDIESADRLLEAVMELCSMQLPNPFMDLNGKSFSVNAAIRPSKNDRIITSVLE